MQTAFCVAARARRVAIALTAAFLAGSAAAHHPQGGAVPSTFWQGLLSGLGHPVIELDHLLFLLVAGVAAALARATPGRACGLLLAYSTAGAFATALRVPGLVLPLAEPAVAVSLLLAAVWLWTRRLPGVATAGLWALGCGFVHGYAYGEAVIGAEAAPLAAYLCGLALIQTLLMLGAYFIARRVALSTAWVVPVAARVIGALVGAAGLWLLWA